MEIYHAAPRVLELLVERGFFNHERDSKRVALTTWETSALPDRYVSTLAAFDSVIVPSWFCYEAVHKKMSDIHVGRAGRGATYIVPHCWDDTFWIRPAPNRIATDASASELECRFLAMGAWGERKNLLGVVKAYIHEFSRDDNTRLLVVSNPDLDEVRSLVARTGIAADKLPRISFPEPRTLSTHDVLRLHCESTCFVSATRGEGWGLGMFEAAALGNDVIAPLYGGQSDFLDRNVVGVLHRNVPFQLTPCLGSETNRTAVERDGQSHVVAGVSIPPGVDCKQVWAEPDLQMLAAHMRDVYEESRRAAFYQRNRSNAVDALRERFEYQPVAKLFETTLRKITWPTLSDTSSST